MAPLEGGHAGGNNFIALGGLQSSSTVVFMSEVEEKLNENNTMEELMF